jgi:hypothetical protein
MALKYNNQFQSSKPPSGLRALDAVRKTQKDARNIGLNRASTNINIPSSLDAARRQQREEKNYSTKLRRKIYDTHGDPKPPAPVVTIPNTFYTFAEGKPAGGEVLQMTFEFSGVMNISNFGDDTGRPNVNSGQTITHIY